ncbi:hypothetical protein QN277_027831 [Acacia crassicarpa]|uniref:Protein Lines C-terminal domain-containing protein n=1 Tax=Acacia crassicarpa TaxID=499986 RepID=A0AAE1JZL7_9FABA|nr:hypothetical protein QN277_027831 [Acacia crassicarpa]
MSPSSELSWLCRLIDESLRSYIEPNVVVLICKEKEVEKEVLVALSQVFRKIQQRIQESVSKEEETVVKTVPNEESPCGLNLHSAAHNCMSKVVTDMMILLTVNSQFVQHLAVKVLALTSKFLFTMGNYLNEFIQFLCYFWEVAIAGSGDENNIDLSDVRLLSPYELKRCDWSTVAGINQVLRAVIKCLKEDYDNVLVKVYYDSVNSSLSKVPWDLLHQFQACLIDGSKKSSSMNPLNVNNFSAMKPEIKFLGTFLQLLCSLVDQNDFVETGGASSNEHPLLVTVVNLVPRLLKWCLNKKGDTAETCIIQYLKHKLLVLMIRLRLYKCLDCYILLSWLEILHNYFQEFLWQPLTRIQSDQNESLEGSPFLLSLSDGEVSGIHSHHLQRQAIFLFLDCSFSLISQKGDPAYRCICSGVNSCLPNEDLEPNFCFRRKGLLELYKWLQGHLPNEVSFNHEKHLEICVNFMSSFLQLYLGEDDLLFEVLLQLLGITSCLQQQYDEKETAVHDIKKDFPFCPLDIFNPVQLFHLFLCEIHYDHQVLLDYLISKDTGISCAKYLLRCLSLVSNSWRSFVGFTLFGDPLNQSSSKKRRVTIGDDPESETDATPFVMDFKGDVLSLLKNYEQDSEDGFNPPYTNPWKHAKECLLSLKDSVENLHQKKLFPYNPEVLLKRLKKFQDVCFKEEGFQHKTDPNPN